MGERVIELCDLGHYSVREADPMPEDWACPICKYNRKIHEQKERIAELEKEKESWRVKCIKYDMRVGDLELRLDKAEGYGRYAKDFKEHPTVIKEASDE